MRWCRLACLAVCTLVACGNDKAKTTTDALPADLVDVRVPIPDPDPNFIDLVTPDEILQPGQETMYCLHLENDLGDVAVTHLSGMQGTGGHHLALFTTTDPKPAVPSRTARHLRRTRSCSGSC